MEKHAYDDIIHLPHPTSSKHPRMSLRDRAAQFSPFSALTGHEQAIKETSRITEEEIELDETNIEKLNEKLQMLQKNKDTTVTITYFAPDKRKEGGEYLTFTGKIKKLDTHEKTVIMETGTIISMTQIKEIQV